MAALDTPLTLPSGVTLKNRIAKSAMSDSLGDGKGNPTASQIRLYERWAAGGVAVSIIGEVQGRPENLEAPGNLVLDDRSDHRLFQSMARRASVEGHLLWLQLGHAGALAYERLGKRRGPSALNLTGLTCEELSREEIEAFPDEMARTAALAAWRFMQRMASCLVNSFLPSLTGGPTIMAAPLKIALASFAIR
jgi:2,4-dienoyl-CoA reductase-like NADH-dependent reductase (Old Yellow Enzyme family)